MTHQTMAFIKGDRLSTVVFLSLPSKGDQEQNGIMEGVPFPPAVRIRGVPCNQRTLANHARPQNLIWVGRSTCSSVFGELQGDF